MSRSWRPILLLVLVASLAAPHAVLGGGGITPTCSNDSVTVNEDGSLNGQVSCSPVDSPADYQVVTGVSDGTLNLNSSDGSFTYTPNADFNGSDSFDYTVQDVDGLSNSATISIAINAVNDEPSFTAGSDQSVAENAPTQTVTNWATGISTGPPNESGQTVNFVVTNNNSALFLTQPAVSPSGTLSYRPAASANGSATVSVKIHDNGGTANGGDDTSPIQTFTVDVTGVNDPPSFTAGPDQTDLEDAGPRSVTNWATNISPGPPDESGQTVTFLVDSNTNPGLFSTQPAVSSSGKLTYTPAADANGSADITLHAHDNGGGSTDDSPGQTFTISLTPVNDAPSFTKGANQTVLENAAPVSVSGWATGVDKGAPNESTQTVSYLVTGDTNAGLFSAVPAVAANGTLTFTVASDTSGSATITLHIKDNGGTANAGQDSGPDQTFSITVTGVNAAPSFTKGPNVTVLEDAGPQTIAGWATNIDQGPGDSGQTVSFVIVSTTPDLFSAGPAVSSSGTLTFTPTANLNGTSTVILYAQDNGGTLNGGDDTSTSQSFTITMTPVNDPPSFTKGANQTVAENASAQTIAGWATTILEGPSNEAGQTVAFQVTNNNIALFSSQPAISPTGSLTYTPASSENGSATISVFLQDNGGTTNFGDDTSAIQTFTITVTGVNDPPTFVKGANVTVLEDGGAQSISNWATSISAGPPDESGQTVSFVIVSTTPDLFSAGPAVSSSGTLTFTPTANLNGTSTVILYAQDNGGTLNGGDDTSTSQSFTITMTPVNDPPSFTKGANQTVAEDSGLHTIAGWATAILEGPADEVTQTVDFVIDSDTNSLLFAVEPAVSPAGVLTYTLAANANGVATIGLHIHDSGGVLNGGIDAASTVTFKITVSGVNDAPTCANDSNATFVDAALNASLISCTDLDANPLTYSLVGGSIHGTTVVQANGTYTYTPNAAFQGTDTFTFKSNDGTVDSNTAKMSILVSPDPIARNDVSPTDFPAIVQGSGATAIPVLANDVDKQGGPLTITAVTQGAKGKVTITGGGTGLTYDPTALGTGTDSFRYTITDNQLRTNSAIVVVSIVNDTVRPVSSAPAMAIISPTALGPTTVKVRISWSATDIGSGVKSYLLQESYNGGAFKTIALASPLTKSVVRSLVIGKAYRYRVRATDVIGNIGYFATGPVFTPVRVQEMSTSIVYSGSWAVASSTTFSGGTDRWASVAGASATYTVVGQGVAWVSSKSSNRGSAQVYVDGVLIKTVSLYASTSVAQQVVFSYRFTTAGPHTVQILNLATAGHPRIDLDLFVVLK